MKTIGIVGILPRITLKYFNELNDLALFSFRKNSSSDIAISTINLKYYRELEKRKDQDAIIDLTVENINTLEKCGASFVLLYANSVYFNYQKIIEKINIPVLHIVDVIIDTLKAKEYKKVILISTKQVTENNFYKELLEKEGIEVVIPNDKKEIEFIDNVIYNELMLGIHDVNSRKRIISIVNDNIARVNDIDALVLGSSLFTHFLSQEHFQIPLIDATLNHIKRAFEIANE